MDPGPVEPPGSNHAGHPGAVSVTRCNPPTPPDPPDPPDPLEGRGTDPRASKPRLRGGGRGGDGPHSVPTGIRPRRRQAGPPSRYALPVRPATRVRFMRHDSHQAQLPPTLRP